MAEQYPSEGTADDAKPWLSQIEDAEKCFTDYQGKCDNIEKLYADLEILANTTREREFQIFWANIEVLKPSIYARPPIPVVTSRFKDRKEIVRHASEILERTLSTSFDTAKIDETMTLIRDDLALCGRGVMWLRFAADDEERVVYEHLDRKDFLHDPARKWAEVGWVARRAWLSREAMRKRFEDASGDTWTKATYTEKNNGKDEEYKGEKKACVWEIWSKTEQTVVWVTPGVEEILDKQDPILSLDDFFPCPKPAYGTVKRGSLQPVPDFLYYKDQVEEINELTARISALSEALRVKGFYAGGNEDIADAIETAMRQQDNNAIMIPVPNFAALGGAGLKDAIVWLPVREIAEVILQLVQLRRQLIEDVYEITGISDIMRGQTDAGETLGAQQLKSQYGSVRIKDRQEALIKIARDATRIAGEIISENFSPETVMAMSQYDEVPSTQAIQQQIAQIDQQIQQAASNPQIMAQAQQNPQAAQQILGQAEQQKQTLANTVTIEAVFEFLRNERMRPFVLDIETDSTIQPDENAQKQRTTEFLGALAQALGQLAPMVTSQPQSAGFAGEVLKFAVAPFRAGRDLEASIDDFVDKMTEAAAQPKPNPEEEKIKADAEVKKAEMQLKQQGLQAEIATKEKELALKQQEAASKMEVEQAKLALDELRLELEATRASREFDERGVERDQAKETAQMDAKTAAGIPPDYSFERESENAQALIEEVSKNRELLETVVQQNAQQMAALTELVTGIGERLNKPKSIVRDKAGEAAGVMIGEDFQPIVRDENGEIVGLGPLN